MNIRQLQDHETEQSILSTIIQLGSEAFYEIADLVAEDAFTADWTRVLYLCIEHVIKQGNKKKLDLGTIVAAAKTLGIYEQYKDLKISERIISDKINPVLFENLRSLAKRIRRLQVARELYAEVKDAGNKLLETTGDEPVSKILATVEDPVFRFTTRLKTADADGIKRVGPDALAYLRNKIANPVDQIGIPTGFPIYDTAIGGGLRGGTISVVGARLKQGKTSWAINVALHVAYKLNIPVLYLDTEMKHEDHLCRQIAHFSGVPYTDIETGKFRSDDDMNKALGIADTLSQSAPCYNRINIGNMSREEQISCMRRWIVSVPGLGANGKANPCLIIYDYLKLMSEEDVTRGMQEYQSLGFLMTRLHDFSVELDFPILAFVQLNRDGISKEDTSIISGSDRIGWLCSNISVLKQKSSEEIAQDGVKMGNRKIVPVVSRHARDWTFGNYINYDFDGSLCRMQEICTRQDIEGGFTLDNDGFGLSNY